jgi:signal transduction histidine kinase
MDDLLQALRGVPLLADLSDEKLQILAQLGTDRRFAPGDATVEAGTPANAMFILLEGEIEGRSEDRPLYTARAGDVTGKLPHSRMVTFPLTVRAVTPVRQLSIPDTAFHEMLERIPELDVRLVGLMADRIRTFTADQVQQSKLAALGKLSAGLAHELNNPASAAGRAADSIRTSLNELRQLDLAVASADLSRDRRVALFEAESRALEHARGCTGLDALTRSDREEELGLGLQRLGVRNAWDLAPQLVDAGFTAESLDVFARQAGDIFPQALARVGLMIALEQLSGEIVESMTRISVLVKSIKEYSYMDTVADRDVDLHQDIENTLRIMDRSIRQADVSVEREYDKDLPKICANGSELNQVWTNLIDNAVDAMAEDSSGRPRVLRIRTARKLNRVVVEVFDTGPGVPLELRDRIFEPFFTTKKQGEGTGLGLDMVQKIVHRHHGDLRLESAPGRTCFQVILPVRSATNA